MISKKEPYLLIYTVLLITATTVYFTGDHGDTVLWANSWHNPTTDFLFKWLTHLGDGIFFGIVTITMLVYKRRTGLLILGMGLAQSLLVFFLKRIIFKGHPRPKTYFQDFEAISLHFVEGVKIHSYNSFPSGHTLTAFALATFMALYYRNTGLSLLFLPLACLAGFSRIYLAQHFLIDVCVGSLLGVMMGYGFHHWHLKMEASKA